MLAKIFFPEIRGYVRPSSAQWASYVIPFGGDFVAWIFIIVGCFSGFANPCMVAMALTLVVHGIAGLWAGAYLHERWQCAIVGACSLPLPGLMALLAVPAFGTDPDMSFGELVVVLLYPVVVWWLATRLAMQSVMWRMKPDGEYCVCCGYSIEGLPDSTCPECGTELSRS